MGWFITKSSNKRPSRTWRKKRRSKAGPDWDPKRTLLGVKVLAASALAAGIVFGWAVAERYLLTYVANTGESVTVKRVVLADAPPWLELVLQPLCLTAAERIKADPMDGVALQQVAQALERSPWVVQVDRVQRTGTGGGRVVVYARYREPVALVRRGRAFHLVDGEGTLLPFEYNHDHVEALGMPVIDGVSAKLPVAAGHRWRGDDLRAGLSLARYLGDEPYLDRIAAIDVSRRDARGRVRLAVRTSRGQTIDWGLQPGMVQVIEPAAKEKRRRLNQLFASSGAIPNQVELYRPVEYMVPGVITP